MAETCANCGKRIQDGEPFVKFGNQAQHESCVKKKYTVTYEYRGKVTVEVEAESEEEAEIAGLKEADDLIINGNLSVYDATVKPAGS